MFLDKCKICGKTIWPVDIKTHVCNPKFEIIHEYSDPDEICVFHASDKEGAVEKWAEEYDSDDGNFGIANTGDYEYVKVRQEGKEEWEEWRVCGEWNAVYFAEKDEE